MAVLKIDLDKLDRAISVYNTEINNIKDAKKSIKSSLSILKSSGWDSNAGKKWFSLLDDQWLKNMDYQIRVLGRLRDNLVIAKNQYIEVYNEQNSLKNVL